VKEPTKIHKRIKRTEGLNTLKLNIKNNKLLVVHRKQLLK